MPTKEVQLTLRLVDYPASRLTPALAGLVRLGRIRPEWVAAFPRNRWPDWIGIGGRIQSESVAGFGRNMQSPPLQDDSKPCEWQRRWERAG
jgi:hypothetical protein